MYQIEPYIFSGGTSHINRKMTVYSALLLTCCTAAGLTSPAVQAGAYEAAYGDTDGMVGTFPEQYHDLFTKNNTDHIWISVLGGGHDGTVGIPLFYNFIRALFKA